MAIGSLLQGLVEGMQYKQGMVRQQQDETIKQDYIKAQKKILDAQIKATEMEEQWWGQQSPEIQKIRFLPKETQNIAMLMAGMQGLPNIMGGTGAPAAPPSPSSYTDAISQMQAPQMTPAAPPQAPAAQQAGVPDMASNLLMRSQWKKMFGIDPGEVNMRTVAGEGGMPVTQGFDITGRPTGAQYPEAVTPVAVDQIDPKTGQTRKVWVNPFQQGGMGAGAPQGGGFVTKPPDIETVTTQSGGVTYEQDINKVTRQPIGAPRVKEEIKGLSGEVAGKIQLAQNGLNELDTLFGQIFNPDGTPNREVLATAVKLPGLGQGVPFSKGRDVRQSFGRAVDAVIRAATGAALTKVEVENYTQTYFPSPLDTDEGARNKAAALEEFLNGYLEKLDPNKQIRFRGGKRSEKRQPKGMKTPPKLGGDRGQADPLGIR